MNFGRVSGRVAERPEQALHQIHEPGVFASFAFRHQSIKRKPRMLRLYSSKGFIHERGTVRGKTAPLPDFLSDAFRRLKYRVEVVIYDELRAAEPDPVRPVCVSPRISQRD